MIDRSSVPADPPPGSAVAEAWTRQDTQTYAATTLGATLRDKNSGFKVGGVFFTLLVVVLVVSGLQGPQEITRGATFLAMALVAVFLVASMFAGGDKHDTSEPVSWRAARETMLTAMQAPSWAGERDPAGERVRVRGRVRAHTVIDGPEGGWCVAWERHVPDSESIDVRTIERAGGIFDVVTDEGLTVRVDARHAAVVDGRAAPQHAARHEDTWTAVIPDGAYVDVVGSLGQEAPDVNLYRTERSVVMSGTEAEPVGLVWLDENGGATGVRVDQDATHSDEVDGRGADDAADKRTKRGA